MRGVAMAETSGVAMAAGARKGLGQGSLAGLRPLPFSGTYERRRSVPPLADVIFADASLPPYHAMLTSKPPRAFSPLTLPLFHARGRAGNSCTAPSWLCTSISATPAVNPKLPSIWNGG